MRYANRWVLQHRWCGRTFCFKRNIYPVTCATCRVHSLDHRSWTEWTETFIEITALTIVAPALASGPGSDSPKVG